jgi:hypothetical protein
MDDHERPGEQGIRGRGAVDDETEGHSDRAKDVTERDDALTADEVSESDGPSDENEASEGHIARWSDRRIKVKITPVSW